MACQWLSTWDGYGVQVFATFVHRMCFSSFVWRCSSVALIFCFFEICFCCCRSLLVRSNVLDCSGPCALQLTGRLRKKDLCVYKSYSISFEDVLPAQLQYSLRVYRVGLVACGSDSQKSFLRDVAPRSLLLAQTKTSIEEATYNRHFLFTWRLRKDECLVPKSD